MNWNISVSVTSDNAVILDGNRIVGSIAKTKPNSDDWHVEILWAPQDITYEAISYPVAVGFVRGVEKTMTAMKGISYG